ncbi:hypothetical protein [Helicobacter typhlonius]|uniref:hypothetical protein n=1 Tax=Helicobacter typhlonius TaxID=76936 RepID=UPI002FE0BE98
MLYDIKELNENDYKKECAKLLIAFENPNYKQENTIHLAGNVTIGYGLDLKTGNNPKLLLKGYLPDDSKKLKIGNKELTFYGIIEKYRANETGFTDPKAVKGYLQNQVFNFSLTQEQAQEVLERTFDSYKQYVSKYINDSLLKCSQEKASLVSLHYHGRFNNIKDSVRNSIIKNSRFLSWFLIRYKTNPRSFIPFLIRACDEADIYLSNPNINKINLMFDIFSYLNIKKEMIEYRIHKIKTNRTSYKQDTLYSLALWYENDLNFIPYQDYITDLKTFQKLKPISQLTKKPINDIITTLKPHLDYLNTLTQKTFNLENIYCIQSFYGVLGAHKLDNVAILNKILNQRFSHNNTNQTNDASSQSNNPDSQTQQENPTQILILYPKATPLPIQIIQPENTFLTLVVGKNAKLDCSKLLLDKCEIHYLQYDENQEESTENPKITALKTDSELTLTTKDSNLYEVIHNGIIYYISKNDGVLKVSLKDKREQAIELYNFAKENEYRILKDSPSQMLDIQLKLQDNKELPTSHNGNFSPTINNLTLLDSKGKNLDITTKQDFTLYLHNCENRQVYTSTTITKNPNSDTYSTTFHFDLILEQTSNLFKRTTKLIVATQNLANDFSTGEIHSKGNVAIISLSSADKQGGSYTFGKRVSAQEFESQAIHTRNQYLASNDDSLAYEVAFGEGEEREEQGNQDDIPDNVIRIETEDNSGEYIEIEFGKSAEEIEREIEEEDKTRQELEEFLGYPSDSIADASDSISHYQALMGNEVKTDIDNIALPRFMPRFNRPKGSKRLHKKNPPKTPEYAKNQKDVMRIVRELPKQGYRLVWKARDFEHLKQIWKRLTKYAKKIEPRNDKKYGERIDRTQLKDKTEINFRQKSKSGSQGKSGDETIDIKFNSKGEKTIWRIHY